MYHLLRSCILWGNKVVQLQSRLLLFATLQTLAWTAPLSSTMFRSSFRFMSIELVTLTISSSAAQSSFCLQSFPAPGSFPVSRLFASGGQSIRASTSASVLPKSSQGWFPLRLTSFISLLSKGLSRVFSSTTVWKHLFFGALPSLFPCSHVRTWWLERP